MDNPSGYYTVFAAGRQALVWLQANGGTAFFGKSGMNARGIVNSKTTPRTWLRLVQDGYIKARRKHLYLTGKR